VIEKISAYYLRLVVGFGIAPCASDAVLQWDWLPDRLP